MTSITGERGGDTVTALSSYAGSDQLLYAVDPRFDLSGVSFSTAGSGDFNLYSYNKNTRPWQFALVRQQAAAAVWTAFWSEEMGEEPGGDGGRIAGKLGWGGGPAEAAAEARLPPACGLL